MGPMSPHGRAAPLGSCYSSFEGRSEGHAPADIYSTSHSAGNSRAAAIVFSVSGVPLRRPDSRSLK